MHFGVVVFLGYRGCLDLHLIPVGFQLLGHNHGEGRMSSLTQF